MLKQCPPKGWKPQEQSVPQQQLTEKNRAYSGFENEAQWRTVRAEMYKEGDNYFVGLSFTAYK